MQKKTPILDQGYLLNGVHETMISSQRGQQNRVFDKRFNPLRDIGFVGPLGACAHQGLIRGLSGDHQ